MNIFNCIYYLNITSIQDLSKFINCCYYFFNVEKVLNILCLILIFKLSLMKFIKMRKSNFQNF